MTTLLAGAWALLLPGRADAVDPHCPLHQLVHDQWHPEHGLPQNSIYALAQTRDGMVWIGTEEGLARFDGVHFDVFDSTTSEALESNWVWALHVDHRNQLWIGLYQGGVAMWDGRLFHHYGTRDGLPSDRVRAFMDGPDGALWIGTSGGGIGVFDGTRFTRHDSKNGLSSDNVTSLATDASGRIYAGTFNGGVNILERGQWRSLTQKDGLPGDRVQSLAVDRQDRVWIGTSMGLALWSGGSLTSYRNRGGLKEEGVRALLVDRAGRLWVGRRGAGLVLWQEDHVLSRMEEGHGLPNNDVAALLEDQEQNLWVGMHGGGVSVLRNGSVQTLTTLDGLTDNRVKGITVDPSGALWVGSSRGLSRVVQGQPQSFPAQGDFADDEVRSVYVDHQGRLLVATLKHSVYVISDQGSQPLLLNGQPLKEPVYVMAEQPGGVLWLGGVTKGLVRVQGQEVTRVTQADGLAADIIWSLRVDRNGDLWAGTSAGIGWLHDGTWTTFNKQDGLGSETQMFFHEDGEGRLWVGSLNGGLSLFEGGRFLTLRKRHGLWDDSVYAILEDAQGRFWMSSNKGISYVYRKDLLDTLLGRSQHLHAVGFGTADGMRTTECNGGALQSAAVKTPDGKLWFSTQNGLAMVDPNRLSHNAVAPRVSITSITVDGAPMDVGTAVELDAAVNRIQIAFAAPSFVAPRRVGYEYQLEGVDPGWMHAGAERQASYTSLSPGIRTFRVRASNASGVPSAQDTTLRVVKPPRFYQTVWFMLVCAVVALGGVVLIVRLRLRVVQRRNRELELLVAEKTSQLKSANDELQEKNRELHERALRDPLTGLRNRRFLSEFMEQDANALGLKMERAFQGVQRRREEVSTVMGVVLLDLDHFKRINDVRGHRAGDTVLKSVAQVLQSLVRQDDVVARWGGEEFLVVLRKTSPDFVSTFAARVRHAIEQNPVKLEDGTELSVTSSVGAVQFPLYEEAPTRLSLEQCISAADLALYFAKEHGRNRAICLKAGSHLPEERQVADLLASLERSLAQGFLALEDADADGMNVTQPG